MFNAGAVVNGESRRMHRSSKHEKVAHEDSLSSQMQGKVTRCRRAINEILSHILATLK